MPDYLPYTFDITVQNAAQASFDSKGAITLRYGADDFLPMVQRAITRAFDDAANGAGGIPGPYQITSLTIMAAS
jgi:hypothetical protein